MCVFRFFQAWKSIFSIWKDSIDRTTTVRSLKSNSPIKDIFLFDYASYFTDEIVVVAVVGGGGGGDGGGVEEDRGTISICGLQKICYAI